MIFPQAGRGSPCAVSSLVYIYLQEKKSIFDVLDKVNNKAKTEEYCQSAIWIYISLCTFSIDTVTTNLRSSLVGLTQLKLCKVSRQWS